MSEFKGTPGPWSRNGYEFFNSDGANILDLTYGSHTGMKEDEANSDLISAAPELLKELEETHAALCFTTGYIGSYRYERNKSVIAKALGQ